MTRNPLRFILGVDEHSTELKRGALYGLGSRVVSIVIVLLFNVLLTRTLGAEQSGLYYLGIAVLTVVAAISLLGLDNGSIRHASNLIADEKWGDLATLFRRVSVIVLVSALLWSLLIWLSVDWLSTTVFSKPGLRESLPVFATALPFVALMLLTSRYIQSVKRPAVSLFLQTACIPATVLLALLLLPLDWTADSVAAAYAFAAIVAFLVAVAAWYTSVPIAGAQRAAYDMSAVLKSGRQLFPANLVNKVVRPWTAVMCLGIWGSPIEIAFYSTANRVAAMISFAVLPVNTILAPKLAVLAARGQAGTLYGLSLRATALIVVIAAPVLLPVVLVPELVMSIFGNEFAQAAAILLVLAVGQLVNVLTGPVQSILVMTGNEAWHKQASFAGGFTSVLLCLLLIPRWGGIGAAWATAGAIVVTNLASAALAWKLWLRTRESG